MTDAQKQEFFDKVKGKKIRWSGWPSGWWFIPYRIETDNSYRMHGTNHCGSNDWYSTFEGFANDQDSDHSWSFVDPQPQDSKLVEQPTEFLPGDLVRIRGKFTLTEHDSLIFPVAIKFNGGGIKTFTSSGHYFSYTEHNFQLELIRRPEPAQIEIKNEATGKTVMISHEMAKEWGLA